MNSGLAAPMTVAVVGPGGVGGLLAALLSRAGHRVICLASEETSQTLARDGIRVSSSHHGDFVAETESATLLEEQVDLCLIAVKNNTLDAALERVPPQRVRGPVVPLLNGVEHVASLRDWFGASQVVPAVIRVISTRTSTGVIAHASPFTEIDLARTGDDLAPLVGVLASAGVKVQLVDSEQAVIWGKLAFLAPFALLTTLHGEPIGAVRESHSDELKALVEEAAAVSRASGGPGDTAQILARYEAFPAEAKSSMQVDAEVGRPLELDAIGGALLRAAERHGIDTPHFSRVFAEVAAR